jgi:hypothetical protein
MYLLNSWRYSRYYIRIESFLVRLGFARIMFILTIHLYIRYLLRFFLEVSLLFGNCLTDKNARFVEHLRYLAALH